MLKVSRDGRSFEGPDGTPYFWLGDTQWNMWRCHSGEEAELILRDRKAKGYTVVQVMLLGWGMGKEGDPVFRCFTSPIHGEAYPDRDLRKPNEEYFRHVDAVVRAAERLGLPLAIGLDHPQLPLADPTSARAWGRWVGERYRERRNIIWVPSYTIPDARHLPVTREIASGLREGYGGECLMSCHPDPAEPYCTSGIAHEESWLDFNSIQTWARYDCIHEAVSRDYNRLPPKPVVMAEGAYEGGREYRIPITQELLRRQAYWSYFAGAHHSYGHNDNWQVPPTWRDSLDAPGARAMGVCRSILSRLSWWTLIPDQSLLVGDPGVGGDVTLAARSSGGEWIAAYLPSPRGVELRTTPLAAADRYTASWMDPRSGEATPGLGGRPGVSYRGSPPRGMEDSLVVLQGTRS